jgi:hypothetical protein
MIRANATSLALAALFAAGLTVPAAAQRPAHKQPTPAAVPTPDKSQDPKAPNAEQGETRQSGIERAWDARMKRTMGGICKGC